jgi:acyl-CoA hydrolase
MKKIKHPRESAVEMTELVLPNDTNLLGNLLGGKLMHWMDLAAGMAASRHSNHVVVTAAVDNLVFHHPIQLGELVNLKAVVTWTGRTSMELLVKVYAENTETGQIKLANEAFFSFVALDKNARPCSVPELVPQTDDEKSLLEEAAIRRETRLKLKDSSQSV